MYLVNAIKSINWDSVSQNYLYIRKEILYIMMRNNDAYENLLSDLNFIDDELKTLKVSEVIESYSKELERIGQCFSIVFICDGIKLSCAALLITK